MNLLVCHTLLISGKDLAACTKRALHFFKTTQLVHYDDIKIIEERCCSARSELFQTLLDEALLKNRERLKSLLAELQDDGYTTLIDLLDLPQGYQSKILHTIAHIEDGFFGIDAGFFDLDESSYRVSERRKLEIRQQPDRCWLLTIAASSTGGNGFEQIKGTGNL